MSTSKPSVCFYCADQNPQRDRSLGITNYTYGLVDALKQNGLAELHAVVSKSSSGVPDGVATTTLPFRTDHILGRVIADHLHPLIVANRMDAQIWHYPKGFLPLGLQVRQPKIGTIADTILQFYADHYPHERSRAAYAYWIAMLENAVRKFDVIITVSEFSKRSILEFAERYRLQKPQVIVTYLGAEVGQTDRKPKGDYMLHLASVQPHKKTNWLLKEWRKLQSNGKSLPHLRLIGQLDAEAREIAGKLKNTQFFSTTTRKQLLEAMSSALALILPSEIEGFGLPALEAYAVGTPVAYVRHTAVEEVLGMGAPGCFSLQDDDSLRQALVEVIGMDAAQIRNKGHELQERFSWQKCVDLTIAGYRSLN
jgi:glycosyltransferase involved in cell wall biosynthesis